jgi:hypothetical protein
MGNIGIGKSGECRNLGTRWRAIFGFAKCRRGRQHDLQQFTASTSRCTLHACAERLECCNQRLDDRCVCAVSAKRRSECVNRHCQAMGAYERTCGGLNNGVR